jgi:uncharacterized protein
MSRLLFPILSSQSTIHDPRSTEIQVSELLLAGCIFISALLYSSVGHGGASGYLAAMALFGVVPAVMKPTALVLNIIVAAIATIKFYRAGCFNKSLFWQFALGSVPCAFLGGSIVVPTHLYKPIVGMVLLYAATRLGFVTSNSQRQPPHVLPQWWAIGLGMLIGLLSGLTGVGGGIFLSPLLLLMGWATIKQAAGVSAAFILVNSISGLLGYLTKFPTLPSNLWLWSICVAVGGWIGAEYGSKRIGSQKLQWLLSIVLVIAGIKLLLT